MILLIGKEYNLGSSYYIVAYWFCNIFYHLTFIDNTAYYLLHFEFYVIPNYALPSFYGRDSQVINNHNVIHIADDVVTMKKPLSDYSSYCFENFLSYLKSLIRSRKQPLEQLNARLSELKAGPETKEKLILHKKQEIVIDSSFLQQNEINLPKIIFHDFILKTRYPDNFFLLRKFKIFQITEIKKQTENILIVGYEYEKLNDVFESPCKSSDIGIMEFSKISQQEKVIGLNQIIRKCIVFNYKQKSFAVTLLHGKICMFHALKLYFL